MKFRRKPAVPEITEVRRDPVTAETKTGPEMRVPERETAVWKARVQKEALRRAEGKVV